MLTAFATVLLAAAPVSTPSPARVALEKGDWAAALALPARDGQERAYVRAKAHLARWEIGLAKTESAHLDHKSREAAELDWYLARTEGNPAKRAEAARRWCRLGDPTGRACAEAELFGLHPAKTTVKLSGEKPILLASGAPFPLALANAQDHETGFVIDSGASETVISSKLAHALGIPITRAGFPVGVAGGGAQAQAHLGLLPALTLGGAQVHDLPVLVMDLPELESLGIEGILSPQQALDGLIVTIDFAHSRMRLHASPPLASRRHAHTVPYFGAGLDLAIAARVGDGPPALFGLDTGMPGACAISQGYFSAPVAQKSVVLSGAGAQFETDRLDAVPVRVGDFELGSGACVESPMRKSGIQLAGLLGNALWRSGSLVLDTRSHTVTIALDADGEAPTAPALAAPPTGNTQPTGI